MKELWQDFLLFLREYWWVWLGVMVLFFGVMVWVALSEGDTPDAPFQYRF